MGKICFFVRFVSFGVLLVIHLHFSSPCEWGRKWYDYIGRSRFFGKLIAGWLVGLFAMKNYFSFCTFSQSITWGALIAISPVFMLEKIEMVLRKYYPVILSKFQIFFIANSLTFRWECIEGVHQLLSQVDVSSNHNAILWIYAGDNLIFALELLGLLFFKARTDSETGDPFKTIAKRSKRSVEYNYRMTDTDPVQNCVWVSLLENFFFTFSWNQIKPHALTQLH